MSIKTVIESLKQTWSLPKKAMHGETETFTELICSFSAVEGEVSADYLLKVPHDLIEFWKLSKEAVLFKDFHFGQWGLKILSPQEAELVTKDEIIRKSSAYLDTDLIIGYFFGDSDKLVIDCSEGYYGRVMVATPLDARDDWYIAANSFREFLASYVKYNGDKFWEE